MSGEADLVARRTERLQVLLDDAELKVIDDWRFQHRLPSRAAAIRELIRRGLHAKGFRDPDPDVKSGDFSILRATLRD